MTPALRAVLLFPFSPNRLYRDGPGLWIEQGDFSTGFQDSAATTRQTAAGDSTGKRLDKSGRGNHLLQATADKRPTLSEPPFSDVFDGIDAALSTEAFSAGTLTANMDLFVTLKRNSTADLMLAYQTAGVGTYILAVADGTTNDASAGSGTPTYYVNGVPVPGGTGTNRTQLKAALPVGSFCVLEIRNVDLSLWTAFALGGYSAGFFLDGNIGPSVLCQAQTDSVRAQIRRYLANKVGAQL